MKRAYLSAGLFLCLATFVAAQDNTPSGTKPVAHDDSSVVQPVTKPVKVNSSTVKAAQTELKKQGYDPGAADGVDGPQTRAAISKYQADKGLKQSGHLDADTLSKLNVGGGHVIASAPSDLGRGGKAFGHDVKNGHPVDAGKALGKGTGDFGKKVGEGTKSATVDGAKKVGHGASDVGKKIDGKSTDDHSQSSQSQEPQ
jgi:Putative peptidoglycan binding domain